MNSLVELIKSWAKVLVVGLVAWLVLGLYFDDAMQLKRMATEAAIAGAIDIILWSVIFSVRVHHRHRRWRMYPGRFTATPKNCA